MGFKKRSALETSDHVLSLGWSGELLVVTPATGTILLVDCDGMTLAECDALADWRATSLFSESEHAALAFTDAMTRDIRVPDDVFADLRRHFDERQIVELAVVIGAYNMHTRVQEALEVDREKPKT